MDEKKLRRIIESKGLKITWVAEQVGVSEDSMHAYLRGTRNPRPPVLKMLAIVLGVPEAELIRAIAV
jgi:transcriptional regulator with XRE-family HTH domain